MAVVRHRGETAGGVSRSGGQHTLWGVDRPLGTVTFLSTDVVGSTRTWERDPERMRSELARHDDPVRRRVGEVGGTVFKHTGDGACASFGSAAEAVMAGVALQRALLPLSIEVRSAVHAGEATREGDCWFGPPLNRTARLLGIGHGRQILVSGTAASLAREGLGASVELRSLGVHRLRDLAEPEQVHQVVTEGLPSVFPPLRSLGGGFTPLPQPRTALVGRSAELDDLLPLLGEHRLVTLTGVGGVGKTRLALAAAGRWSAHLADGAVFVDLAPVSAAHQVAEALAAALGMSVLSAGMDDVALFLREPSRARVAGQLRARARCRSGAGGSRARRRAGCGGAGDEPRTVVGCRGTGVAHAVVVGAVG